MGIGVPVVDFAPLPKQHQQDEVDHADSAGNGTHSHSPTWDARFAAYLQHTLPAFVLVSDVFARVQEDEQSVGTGMQALQEGQQQRLSMIKPSLPQVPQGLATLTMALALRCLAQRASVAYMSSMRCDTITAYAFLASAEKNGHVVASE
jgi:hypothetical protein